MIQELTLPELGENIQTGVIINILVDIGDKVDVDQAIIELETDKAVVEVPSVVSGVITGIHVAEGDEIKVGQLIVSIDSNDSIDMEDEPKPPLSQTSDSEMGSQQASVMTPPIEPSMPSVSSRIENDKIDEPSKTAPFRSPRQTAPAAPSVRRFAREIGVNIYQVPGSGPGGRISLEDIKEYARTQSSPRDAYDRTARMPAVEPLPDFAKWGDVERVPMSMVRKKTATHLTHAWNTVPQVTQFDQADMTGMEAFRQRYGEKALDAGGKLTVTAILMKIVAVAMTVFPRINAAVDMQNEEVVYKKYFNIGVAVDTDRGLLVPVVKNVDTLSLMDISTSLKKLADKARAGKLALADMQGGNFTISNLGGIGGTAFTPIVNAPEVAILGVSRAFRQTCTSGESPDDALILPLSLSYDHRIIDGAEGARFLGWIKEAIEHPLLLLMGA